MDVMFHNLIRIFTNWSFSKGITCVFLLGQVLKQIMNIEFCLTSTLDRNGYLKPHRSDPVSREGHRLVPVA